MLKIQLRMQQVKQAFQGIQVDPIDGEVVNIADLSNAAKALHNIGFEVLRVGADGKETFATVSELAIFLSKAIDQGTISTTELRRTIDALAGQRQSEALLALINNMDEYTRAMSDYENSTGSAMQEAMKSADSWEGRLNKLNNAWIGFVSSFTGAGSIIPPALSVITKAVEILSNPIVRLPLQLAAVSAAVIGLKVAFDLLKANAFGTGMTTAIGSLVNWFKILLPTIGSLTAGTMTLSEAFTALSLNPAIIWFTLAAAAVIGIAKAIDYANSSYERHVKNVDELSSEYQQLKNDLQSAEDELKNANSRMEELLAIKNPTLVEQAELAKLQQTNKDLETQISLLKMREDITNRKLEKAATTSAEDFVGKYLTEYAPMLDQIGQFKSIAQWDIDIYNDKLKERIELEKEVEKLKSEIEASGGQATKEQETSLKNLNKQLDKVDNTLKNTKLSLLNAAEEAQKFVDNLPEGDLKNRIATFIETVSNLGKTDAEIKLDKFNKVFESEKFKDIVDRLKEIAEQGKLTAETLSDQKYAEFTKAMKDAGIKTEEVFGMLDKKIKDLGISAYNFQGAYEGLINKTVVLSKALSDQSSTGKISKQTFEELSSILTDAGVSNEKLDDYLKVTSNGYEIVTKKVNEFANSLVTQAVQAAITGGATSEQVEKLSSLSLLYQNINDMLKAYSDGMSLADTATQEMNSNGEISVKTLQSLIDAGYGEYIDDSTGKIIANTKAIRDKINADQDAAIALRKKWIEQNNADLAIAQSTLNNRLAAKAQGATGNAIDDQIKSLNNQIQALYDKNKAALADIKTINLNRQAVENLTKSYLDQTSVLRGNKDLFQKAQIEMINDGKLSLETYLTLLEKFPTLMESYGDTSFYVNLSKAAEDNKQQIMQTVKDIKSERDSTNNKQESAFKTSLSNQERDASNSATTIIGIQNNIGSEFTKTTTGMSSDYDTAMDAMESRTTQFVDNTNKKLSGITSNAWWSNRSSNSLSLSPQTGKISINYNAPTALSNELSSVHPETARRVNQFFDLMEEEFGKRPTVTSAYRPGTWEEANNSGTKNFGSMHNYGMAVDFNYDQMLEVAKQMGMTADQFAEVVKQLAATAKLESGLMFGTPDRVHVGIPKAATNQIQMDKYGLTAEIRLDTSQSGNKGPGLIIPVGAEWTTEGNASTGLSPAFKSFTAFDRTTPMRRQEQPWTADQINKLIDSKVGNQASVMKNMGQAFIDAAKATGISVIDLLTQAAHESDWGRSNIARTKGNFYGIGAFDSSPFASAYQFGDVADNIEAKAYAGIVEGAKWIATNYVDKGQDTFYKLRWNDGSHEYATDPEYDTKLADLRNLIYQGLGADPLDLREWVYVIKDGIPVLQDATQANQEYNNSVGMSESERKDALQRISSVNNNDSQDQRNEQAMRRQLDIQRAQVQAQDDNNGSLVKTIKLARDLEAVVTGEEEPDTAYRNQLEEKITEYYNSQVAQNQITREAADYRVNIELTALNEAYSNLKDYEKRKTSLQEQANSNYDATLQKLFDDLEYRRSGDLISEQQYWDEYENLVQSGYGNNIRYADKYRQEMQKVRQAKKELAEQQLLVDLDTAVYEQNYQKQLEIYQQLQGFAQQSLNELIAGGMDISDDKAQEQIKKLREYSVQIVKAYDEMFANQRDSYNRHLSQLDFRMSITPDTDYAKQESIINDEIDTRIKLSQKLVDQMVILQTTTSDSVKGTQEYKATVDNLTSAYEDNIKSVYEAVNAQKTLAEKRISAVRDLNNKIIEVIKQRYQDEYDAIEKINKAEQDSLKIKKDTLQDKKDAAVKGIDKELKAWEKLWDEEDKQKKNKQLFSDADIARILELQDKINKLRVAAATGDMEAVSKIEELQKELTARTMNTDLADIAEIQGKLNRLMIAANTGDAYAISQVEDLQKQLRDKKLKYNEEVEKERRDAIKTELQDRKDAINDQFDIESQAIENRNEVLDDELKKAKEYLDEHTKIGNLQVEARKEQINGLSESIIKAISDYEDKWGEGAGILGESVHSQLTIQLEEWQKALSGLAKDVEYLRGFNGVLASIGKSVDAQSKQYQTITEQQSAIIQQIKANMDEISKTSDPDKIISLLAMNRELGKQGGLTIDGVTGIWYLDEAKTQKAFDTITGLNTAETTTSESIMAQYTTEYNAFDTMQTNKTNRVQKFKNDTINKSDELYRNVLATLQAYELDFTSSTGNMGISVDNLISRIQQAINSLTTLGETADKLSGTKITVTRITQEGTSVQQYASGGQVVTRGGLAILDNAERVLTAQQTESFNRLVDNMENFNDIFSNRLSSQNFELNDLRTMGASFNFYGSVTSEALPQLQNMINSAINSLRKDVPSIVASRMVRDAKQNGTGFRR